MSRISHVQLRVADPNSSLNASYHTVAARLIDGMACDVRDPLSTCRVEMFCWRIGHIRGNKEDLICPGHMPAGSACFWEKSAASGSRLHGGSRALPVAGGARYHSHTDEAADAYAGLMGAVIVSKRGTSRPDGTPSDVDRCALHAAFSAPQATVAVSICTSAHSRHIWLPGYL